MKSSSPSPKRRASRADPAKEAEEKLAAAEKRIKKLERELENRNDEIDLLKRPSGSSSGKSKALRAG